MLPLLLPPPLNDSDPLLISTLPLLLSGRLRRNAPLPADLTSVPALLNCIPLPLRPVLIEPSNCTSQVAPTRLSITAPCPVRMVPPLQMTRPPFSNDRPSRS